MSDEERDFLAAVEAFGQGILGKCPEIVDVLREVREGTATVEDAVRRVWSLGAANQELASRMEAALLSVFGIRPMSTDLAHFPDRRSLLDRWGFSDEDLVFRPFKDRPGYAMLHPLLMGMIVELLQFDGDVPELRTGRLPEKGRAAVPVKTTSRDPVVVGAMLRRASQEVTEQLRIAQAEHDENVARMLVAVGDDRARETGLVRQEIERGASVDGYEPGRVVAPRDVETPTAAELSAMTFSERQDLAHLTLTSTQGRRSVAPVIEDMVLARLHEAGFTGTRTGRSDGDAIAVAEWSVLIDGGRTERNPNFNFVDVAAKALASKLCREIAGQAGRLTRMVLHVSPINTVSERVVGWRASLLE